jgi:23S rRNA (cytidine1920-2'-O)/16S rRNA (cytidine1409-2'-O)-methyltransferase
MEKTPKTRMRADQLLVARGLSESRARAQASIAVGLVTADGVRVMKPSQEIGRDARLEATSEYP